MMNVYTQPTGWNLRLCSILSAVLDRKASAMNDRVAKVLVDKAKRVSVDSGGHKKKEKIRIILVGESHLIHRQKEEDEEKDKDFITNPLSSIAKMIEYFSVWNQLEAITFPTDCNPKQQSNLLRRLYNVCCGEKHPSTMSSQQQQQQQGTKVVLVAISSIGWSWIQELLIWMNHSSEYSPPVNDWLSGLILVHPSSTTFSSSSSQPQLGSNNLELLIPSTIPCFVILSTTTTITTDHLKDKVTTNTTDKSFWSSLFINRPNSLVLIIDDEHNDDNDTQSLNSREKNTNAQHATNPMKKYIEHYHWLVWLSRTVARYTEALEAISSPVPSQEQKQKLFSRL